MPVELILKAKLRFFSISRNRHGGNGGNFTNTETASLWVENEQW